MPESRRGDTNRYCKSIEQRFRPSNDLELSNVYNKIIQCRRLETLSSVVTDRSRYYKINIEAYWRHKTVEFRHHSGTIEFEKISNWIQILNRLINFSETRTFPRPDWNLFLGILNVSIIAYVNHRRQKFGF